MDTATKPRTPPLTGNVKVTRDDWFGLALRTFKSDGVEHVRVLSLSQKLGVSRGSFYWYFESRQALLDMLLDHWRDTNTRYVLEGARRPAPTITRGVLNIFEAWIDDDLFDPELDFAVRAWARRSAPVHRAVEEADMARVDAIRDLFLAHGYEAEDAFARARVLYFMQIGYYVLELHEPREQRLSYVRAYLRSFTGSEASDEEIESFAALVRDRKRPGKP
jgi:AcrR family transcriptional regulator